MQDAIDAMPAPERRRLAAVKAKRDALEKQLLEEIHAAMVASRAAVEEKVRVISTGGVQTLVCRRCKQPWQREAKRGRPPVTGPCCR